MSHPTPQPFTAGLPPDSLAGQVIVVGAGQAVGGQLASTFAHLGARVVLTAPAPEIKAKPAANLHVIPTEPEDAASLAALVEQVHAEFGSVDALVQSAPPVAPAPFVELSTAGWDDLVSRNLRRTFLLSQAFLPAMLTRGQGALLNLVYPEPQPGLAAMSAAQHGLAGFTQALAAEVGAQAVRAVTLAAPADTAPEALAGAAAYLLVHLLPEYHGAVVSIDTVLERAGFDAGTLAPSEAGVPDRAAGLAQALTLSQQLISLLMDTDSEFDRLPVAVRPMARGVFLSKVGYRNQDVLRAVHKLADQLQRMQASHSGTDTEFQVDFPRLAGLFERLIAYYQSVPDETARFTTDQSLLAQLRRQMTERQSLIHSLLSTLTAVHTP